MLLTSEICPAANVACQCRSGNNLLRKPLPRWSSYFFVHFLDGPTRYKTTVKAAKPKYTAEVGEDAFLICVGEQVEDDVLTFLSWELNGKKLNTSNVHYRATNTFYDQKDGATPKVQMNLTIFDVDHSDEGNYSCVVHSDYVERASDSIILEVKESGKKGIYYKLIRRCSYPPFLFSVLSRLRLTWTWSKSAEAELHVKGRLGLTQE